MLKSVAATAVKLLIRRKLRLQHSHGERAESHNDAGEREEEHDVEQVAVAQVHAVDAHGNDLVRAEGVDHLTPERFEKNHDTSDFHAAGGRSRTTADEHQRDKQPARKIRPLVKVRRGETRCRHDGNRLERRRAKAIGESGGFSEVENIGCDEQRRDEQDP